MAFYKLTKKCEKNMTFITFSFFNILQIGYCAFRFFDQLKISWKTWSSWPWANMAKSPGLSFSNLLCLGFAQKSWSSWWYRIETAPESRRLMALWHYWHMLLMVILGFRKIGNCFLVRTLLCLPCLTVRTSNTSQTFTLGVPKIIEFGVTWQFCFGK